MKVRYYLTVNSKGSVRTTKTKPDIGWDEITVECELTVPDSVFKRPHITAALTIPEEAVKPREITTEVQDNIKEAIEQAASMHVTLVVEPEKEEGS